MSERALHRTIAFAAATAIAVSASACGGDSGGGDAERFCGEIDANRTSLTQPTLRSVEDVEPLLDLYRRIGDLAPLAVEDDWDQLTLNYETASTVVPGDAESLQRAVATAYESEQSAAAVDRWLRTNCGIDLGPMTTLVAHDE